MSEVVEIKKKKIEVLYINLKKQDRYTHSCFKIKKRMLATSILK